MRFFAPEIVRTGSKKVVLGRQADVWATAVTIYRMVTNKFPFTSNSIPGIQK